MVLRLLRSVAQQFLDFLVKILDRRNYPGVPKVHLDPNCEFRRRQCHQMLQARLDLVDLLEDSPGHRCLGLCERLLVDHGADHGSRWLRHG